MKFLRYKVLRYLCITLLFMEATVVGATPLRDAVVSQNRARVGQLLAQGADPNQHDEAGFTPLHWAIRDPQLPMVELLLDAGADPTLATAPPEETGYSPLHFAAFEGNAAIVQLLLDQGANINRRSKLGDTPLHVAGAQGHREVLELLLEQGASVALQNEAGQRAAEVATEELQELIPTNELGFLRFLVSYGYNFTAPSELFLARSSLELGFQMQVRWGGDWSLFAESLTFDFRLRGQARSREGATNYFSISDSQPNSGFSPLFTTTIPYFAFLNGYVGNDDVVFEWYLAKIGFSAILRSDNQTTFMLVLNPGLSLTIEAINSTLFAEVEIEFLDLTSVTGPSSLNTILVVGYAYQLRF